MKKRDRIVTTSSCGRFEMGTACCDPNLKTREQLRFGYIAEEMVAQFAQTMSVDSLSLPKSGRAFLGFLQQFADTAQAVRMIIILDEVGALPQETAVKLSHTIRAVFTNRLIKKEYQRYLFILAGAADMLHLATSRNSPLKNVTDSVYLGDLTRSEVEQLLAEAFSDTPMPASPAITHPIFAWTSGHPYWTQLLAAAVSNQPLARAEESVDRIAGQLLQTEDRCLPHISRALPQEKTRLWKIVESLLREIPVPFSRGDLSVAELELIGVVKNLDGRCAIRNRLYQAALETQLIRLGRSSATDSKEGRRWKHINQLFHSALEREACQRAAYLDEACAGDETLRREVESLLASHERTRGFIDEPALAVVAREIAAEQAGAEPLPLPAPGMVLGGRYLIEKQLGRGGIGVAFLARDQRLHRAPVVIKLLLESLRETEHKAWFEKKFAQEIKALARIDHPGVVRALDVGELPDGRTYLVMQYVSGVSLRSVMQPHGMDLLRVAKLLRQAGQALTAAHEKGVFHRDLKPENIMLHHVGDEEYVKLIDFGIATVLESLEPAAIETTKVVGTIGYMAPEQLQGRPVAASDIYALGVLAYEMVTGRRPFIADSLSRLLELQRAGIRVKLCDLRPGLPEAAQTVILKALSFNPQDRYAVARNFGDALARALAVEREEGRPPELELAHVLFTDLVGYSQLPHNRQVLVLQEFQGVVSRTAVFQRSQANHQLISLPTGDGMALVFFGDPLAPVQCALEVAHALRARPELRLRMGIHTGPVRRVADINQNANASGAGINMAQRVMDCGDAGHILLSKTVAEILGQLGGWEKYLYDIGEHEVKHGVRVHLINLYTGELGNPATPQKLRR